MDINHTPLTPGSSLSRKSGSRSAAQASSGRIGSMSSPGKAAPAKALAVGQTIRGEVTDLRNHQATITMEDNTQVTARLENGAQLSIGDTASFQVQEISTGSIILKLLPMSDSLVAGNAIMKALEEAGLPRNDKNIAVVRQLIHHQMPINKAGIQQLLRQSYQFKDADLSTLVLMNRHHIPVTEGNVAQFEAYRHSEHQILNKITDLSQEIPQLLSELTKENSGDIVAMFGEELLSLLPNEGQGIAYQPPLFADILSLEDRTALMAQLPEGLLSEDLKEAVLNGTATAGELLTLLPEQLLEKPPASLLAEQLMEHQAANGQLVSFLSSEELSSLAEELRELPLSPSLKEMLASGEASSQEFMATVREALPQLSGSQVSALFQSPVFQRILQEDILSGWTLKAKELTKEKAVEKLYDSMEKSLSGIEKLLKGALPDSEAAAALSSKAQNVQQNMNFMHVLNQFFPYIQLPLHFQEQMTHGDLYVFTKKKDLAQKKDQISVLLHLDMEQLGPLDIHLSLNRNEISSSFYVEDRSVERLLRSHIEELSEALAQKGYAFSSSFSIRERSVDIVRDFMEKEDTSSKMKRYSFDIRA